jgi:hypothetical protein
MWDEFLVNGNCFCRYSFGDMPYKKGVSSIFYKHHNPDFIAANCLNLFQEMPNSTAIEYGEKIRSEKQFDDILKSIGNKQ